MTTAEPYRLRLTTFPAGLNIYTGVVQGGHAYASIEAPDGERHDLTFEVDQDYLDAIAALGNEDDSWLGYQPGEHTTRLRDREHALTLAREWMREHAPAGTLVHDWFDDEVFYAPEEVQP